MNEEMNYPGSLFGPKKTKEKPRINQLSKESIFNLTWNDFHQELCQLKLRTFLHHYGFTSKARLQLFIAKSNLWKERVTLLNFEVNTRLELIERLGDKFYARVSLGQDFDPKKHKLSTIHHYIFNYKLNSAATNLGFHSTQSFLSFFARTLFVPDCSINKVNNLRVALNILKNTSPIKLREELGCLYDQSLVINKNFKLYDYSLEEIKLALERESVPMVIASLGACRTNLFNKKLEILRPILNIRIEDLKRKSWAELSHNAPTLLWKTKLYRLFSETAFQPESFFQGNNSELFFRLPPQNTTHLSDTIDNTDQRAQTSMLST